MNNTLQRIWKIRHVLRISVHMLNQALYQKPYCTMKKRGLGRVFSFVRKP